MGLPVCRWEFPEPTDAPSDLVACGADLEPQTLLAAYRRGLFPMPLPEWDALGWFSPLDRAVLPIDGMHVSRSLRRSTRRYTVTFDQRFTDVVRGCADPTRSGGWIDDAMASAYQRLHELGYAHSVEVLSAEGSLAGGLYGVALGGLFSGESMFRRQRDASKVALLALVRALDDGVDDRLLDVQWCTPHLASLGAVRIGRAAYLARLRRALTAPPPAFPRTPTAPAG